MREKMDASNVKQCSTCKLTLRIDQFRPHKQCTGGRAGQCKKCTAAKTQATFQTRGLSRADYNARCGLKTRYGLTPEQYDAMLAAQGGCCAICGALETHRHCQRLSVDHDHVTGEVRGILCSACNRALGSFRDNVDVMRAAIEYLRRSRILSHDGASDRFAQKHKADPRVASGATKENYNG